MGMVASFDGVNITQHRKERRTDLDGGKRKEMVMRMLMMMEVPLWVAVLVGVVLGWSWRPRWAALGVGLVVDMLSSRLLMPWTWAVPPGFGARRLWFAITALTAFPLLTNLLSNLTKSDNRNDHSSSSSDSDSDVASPNPREFCESSGQPVVTDSDLENLLHMLQIKDTCPPWQQIMNRSTSTMSYQAWRYEPERGPTAYCSRTVIEDVNPELVRDFFWDDEFRPKWDDMLIYFRTLEECPITGTFITHWIRKFPFFCSDREYIIGRRIWECGKTYYCVTKGISHPSVPRCNKPIRVDLYQSSWRIRGVESCKGDGQMTACEVTLFHNEDMGIPREIAKIGVRQGMWGAVKKIEPGIRAYQIARKSNPSLSQCACMARITTKMPMDKLKLETSSSREDGGVSTKGKQGIIAWKWVLVGGAVAVACGIDKGVVSKAVIFGIARRFGWAKKRCP